MTNFVTSMLVALKEFLASEAGHICVGFLLLGVGAAFFEFKVPKGEDLIIAGSTLIGRAMIGSAK